VPINQVVQQDPEMLEIAQEIDEVIETLDEFITDEEEDAVMEQMFKPILPCVGHEVESVKDETVSIDNLIQDAKAVGTTEPSLFDNIDAKKERLEEIREELNNESISYGELVELEELVEYIEEDDVQLLEAAGVPEFEEMPTMSEDQIQMVKEEHGIVEKGSPDDGLIGSKDGSPESLFDMMEEYDEPVDEIPWFTDENANQKVDLAPSLIPDSMREAVAEILEDKYKNKRTVVNTIEDVDYVVFELDSKEFFVVDK
jgi:Rad3-related DNA helicase